MPEDRSSDAFNTLLRYFSQPPKGPSSVDVAKFIVLNAATDKPLGPGMLNNGGNEPSLMGRIFDILSRPNYAVAEAFRTGGNPEAIWKGITGERKTTFSDVLEQRGMEAGPLRGGLGFILDVGLDPTTYIPAGTIAKGAKAISGATKSGKAARAGESALKDTTLAQRLLNRGEPVHPESFGLPTREAPAIPLALKRPATGQPVPRDLLKPSQSPFSIPKASEIQPGQLELPLDDISKGLPKLPNKTPPVDPAKDTIKAGKGQMVFKFPGFNISKTRADTAAELIRKAANNEIEAVAKVLPKPKPKADKRDIADATEILGKWNPSAATAELNRRFPESLNARQQVKLYYQARAAAAGRFKKPNAPANKVRIESIAFKIYSAVEKALEDKGFVPRIGTGENVRLSDVITEMGGTARAQEVLDQFGTEIKQGGNVGQAIEALRARGAIEEAKSVKLIADKIQEAAATSKISNKTSDAFQKDFEDFLKSFGNATARATGLSPAGIRATDKLVETALKSGKSAAEIAVEQKSKMIDEIIARGKANPEVNTAITRALESDLGQLPRWSVNDNKAVEFLMGRIATWWGQSDLRPLSLNAIGSSAATATARGKALDNLFTPYNQAQRHEAFKLAQGIGVPTSKETYELGMQVKRMMDNLVGQVSGASVLFRSGVHMDMLNKWMRWYKVGFEFSNKSAKNILGETVDFSKGTDWVNSWKTFSIKDDPKLFLFKMQQAMEQATREKALFDEIGERFGQKVPGKGFKNKIEGYPYLEGYYFTDDIAKQLPRVVKDWSLPNWSPKNKVVQLYDRVLSMWKAGVTIYRPGHHIRNMVGDVYLGWMDGVNSVRPYILAARVQRSLQGMYKDLNNVDQLVQVGILGKGFSTPRPNEVLFKNKSGVPFTAEQIAAVAHQKGLLEHVRTLEDIIDMGESSKFKPFGGKVQAVARGASELQSHNARLAHFIDKVMKSRGSNIQDIFEQASRRARKWHPTGLDLTDFERKVMRRILPFYSWVRKSTPLLIEGLLMNPGKAVIPSKLYGAIQDSQGIETPGRHDPFPVDQMFPEWLRAQGVGPIAESDSFLGSISDQIPPGYVMGGIGLNPLADLVTQIESPGKTLTSSLTPAIGLPFQLATGRKSFTGEPISGPEARPGAMEQFIGEQIPIWSMFQGISGVTPFGTDTKKASRSDEAGTEALINWLTAAGVRGTGPYIKQGRYEKEAPRRAQQKVNKEQFLQQLRDTLGGG